MLDRPLSIRTCLSIAFALAASLASGRARAADASPGLALPDRADPAPRVGPTKLSLSAATGWLASPGANGAAIEIGLRLGLARHLALSFDFGYGVLAATSRPTVQDRWWIMPALAYVGSAGRVRFELGAGLGLGASSGYESWAGYVDKPFAPVWAYQLMPTARLHAQAAIDVTPSLAVFARVEAAKLLASGDDTAAMDTTWATLSVGASIGVR